MLYRFLPIALCSLLVGCKKETLCSTEIIFSVNVEVLDEEGELVEDAAPTYSVDGGEVQSCEQDGIGGFNCGEDQAGDVTVYVSVEGYEEDEQSVMVEEDECHVTQESLSFQLVASD